METRVKMTAKTCMILLSCVLLFTLASCKQDLETLEQECSQRTSLYINSRFTFIGFDFEELQSIQMIRRTAQNEVFEESFQLLATPFSYNPRLNENRPSTVSISSYSLAR